MHKNLGNPLSGSESRAFDHKWLRRIAAVLHDPPVLVLDEPTVGVDTQSRNSILESILELREQARQALGERFSLRQFHNVVLGAGVVPLPILERAVQDYIKAQS